ncbi:hypothetical protein DPMN_079203 [Dreissena polymorpha]|uniref:Uncharacterized protein n=1 Tax=Dreissena polymorpha TaxID=45954 RepID=A0A9D4BQW0_DREPO|nr:hypothetical protein DPMN_079203 [Dreissena polymorpha]
MPHKDVATGPAVNLSTTTMPLQLCQSADFTGYRRVAGTGTTACTNMTSQRWKM